MQLAARGTFSSPRWITWFCSLGLLAAGAFLYLLDSHTQRFEDLLLPALLHEFLAPLAAEVTLPHALRFWLPDFAWALVAALFTMELLTGTPVFLVRLPAAVLAATSWELLQAAGMAAGVFDPVDLAVSAAAGALAWHVHRSFIDGGQTT